MLQGIRKRRLEATLADWLETDERMLVASIGLHPSAMMSIGFYATFLLGFGAGVVIGNVTGLGVIALFFVLMSALVAWWYYLSRNPSGEQPAGLEPLVGLTDRKIMFHCTGLWGRTADGPFAIAVPAISSFAVKRLSLFPLRTHLTTNDGTNVKYRILHARRIKKELERLGVGEGPAGRA